jgi:hypothetical protein
MRPTLLIVVWSAACVTATAQDREAAALRQLSGKTLGPDAGQVMFTDANGDGIRDGIKGTTVTLAQVRAHTNAPAFLAYWPTSPEYAAWQAALNPYPSPHIIAPMFDTNGVAVGTATLIVDADTKQVIGVVNSASPQKPWAEQRAAAVAEMTAQAAHRANLAAIKTDLDQVEAALDQIDATTTGPMGVAIAATSGATKTALTEVRKVLVDMKTATKNLKQASEKLRREVR